MIIIKFRSEMLFHMIDTFCSVLLMSFQWSSREKLLLIVVFCCRLYNVYTLRIGWHIISEPGNLLILPIRVHYFTITNIQLIDNFKLNNIVFMNT